MTHHPSFDPKPSYEDELSCLQKVVALILGVSMAAARMFCSGAEDAYAASDGMSDHIDNFVSDVGKAIARLQKAADAIADAPQMGRE